MSVLYPIIACRAVSVRRGGRDALRGVDLTVPQGVFGMCVQKGQVLRYRMLCCKT